MLKKSDLVYVRSCETYICRETQLSMAWNYSSITGMHRILYDNMSSKWQVETWVRFRIGSPWYLYKKIK